MYAIHDTMKSAKYAREAIHDRLTLYSTSSSISINGVKPLRRKYSNTELIPTTENKAKSIIECVPLETCQGHFINSKTKQRILLKGINIDSQTKIPTKPYMPSYEGDSSDPNNIFFDGDNVSFIGRPFPIEEAKDHLQRIKNWGYNTIRYLITWEAIEHKGPGIYDIEFINYTIEILKIIGEIGGLYVFLEFHQDVWSRFSGGSGAPMWTFYAASLDPKNFVKTEAAILHNDPRFHDSSDTYHKMLWTSNYKRLASLVMFTLFYAGNNYFPNLLINGENIQDYLQNRFFNSINIIWKTINEKLPELIENGTILGFESMNEPNCGLIGHPDLGVLPDYQQLRVGTTPTAFETMKLGMGFTVEVDEYRISVTGPRKYGTKIVDPKGTKAWLSPEEAKKLDAKYGFIRSGNWNIGNCIFANEGIWTWNHKLNLNNLPNLTQEQRLEVTSKCELIEPKFFSDSKYFKNFTGPVPKIIDTEYFVNSNFVEHFVKFKNVIREINPNAFVLLSVPVLELPPNIRRDSRKIIDEKTVYCPHYYDGLSLMFKSWNTKYNVDTLGIMRCKYLNPVLGIVFGERAIRNCIKNQFIEMRKECNENLGEIPILMSETGMPFDMDEKRSYRNGKYISQTAALDAIINALEGAHMSHTFWCYNSSNNHKWGDNWNNEDFSFWSPDDRNLSFEEDLIINSSKASRLISKATKMGQSSSTSSRLSSRSTADSENFEYESDCSSIISSTTSNVFSRQLKKCFPSPDGVRAISAVVRPYLVSSFGKIVAQEFDIKSVKYSLQINIKNAKKPSIIFVPKWHYPFLDYGDIYLTSGSIKYNEELQYIEWHHDDDENNNEDNMTETIIIKNNSGSLEEAKMDGRQLQCPIT
ncbi:unnamed protein product [Candida verbasci]|uniref:Glycosyl hydrolase n=1 Tax=Candida verbasci TaxID=1227364 RepID=A0A9W4TZE7_9ASCO|nr:unnamed protein product [Candida verbasci]